jgi:AcrR family transcriptional regulator
VHGLEGLTIGGLASDLEMSKSGLFAHFGSKQDLQLAAVDAAAQRFIEAVVRPALAEEQGEPRLRALVNRYLDYLEAHVFPGGCFWASAGMEFDDRPGPVRDRIRDGVAAWAAGLADQARVAGADEPEQLAFELQAMIQGANYAYQLFGDRQAFDRARTAVRGRLSGLR